MDSECLHIPDSFALTYGRTIAIATNRRRSSFILFPSSFLIIIDYELVVFFALPFILEVRESRDFYISQ